MFTVYCIYYLGRTFLLLCFVFNVVLQNGNIVMVQCHFI